jgi:hypothetical protein
MHTAKNLSKFLKKNWYYIRFYVNPIKTTIQLTKDACGIAIGAILSQKDEKGEKYTCCYSSRLLKVAEIHYGITEKECLAVIWAFKLL